jgi:hypothetical protein
MVRPRSQVQGERLSPSDVTSARCSLVRVGCLITVKRRVRGRLVVEPGRPRAPAASSTAATSFAAFVQVTSASAGRRRRTDPKRPDRADPLRRAGREVRLNRGRRHGRGRSRTQRCRLSESWRTTSPPRFAVVGTGDNALAVKPAHMLAGIRIEPPPLHVRSGTMPRCPDHRSSRPRPPRVRAGGSVRRGSSGGSPPTMMNAALSWC